jgi:hypothetical protein
MEAIKCNKCGKCFIWVGGQEKCPHCNHPILENVFDDIFNTSPFSGSSFDSINPFLNKVFKGGKK